MIIVCIEWYLHKDLQRSLERKVVGCYKQRLKETQKCKQLSEEISAINSHNCNCKNKSESNWKKHYDLKLDLHKD